MDKSSSEWKDRLGIFASALCAVHCAATPFLLVFLPTLQFTEWMASPLFHQIAAVICVALVAISIVPAYRKHKDVRVLSFSGAGLAMILAAAFCLPDYCCEGGHHAHGEHNSQNASVAGIDTVASGNIHLVSSTSSASSTLSKCKHENCTHSHAPKPVVVEKSTCSHEGCSHSHSKLVSTKSPASATQDCCSSKDSCCEEKSSDSHDDVVIAGLSGEFWSVVQPWMTPIGGLLLMVAHGLNMRRSFGSCSTRCGCDSSSIARKEDEAAISAV